MNVLDFREALRARNVPVIVHHQLRDSDELGSFDGDGDAEVSAGEVVDGRQAGVLIEAHGTVWLLAASGPVAFGRRGDVDADRTVEQVASFKALRAALAGEPLPGLSGTDYLPETYAVDDEIEGAEAPSKLTAKKSRRRSTT